MTERRAPVDPGHLADLHRALAGEHPDWDEYYRAMVDDRRLLARITFANTYHGGAHA